MKFILGTKVNMTQLFDEKGVVHAVTVIKTGPVTVTQLKTKETDGYEAVQVGFGARKEKNTNNAQKPKGTFRLFTEIPFDPTTKESIKVGDIITLADTFVEGDSVTVSGISKAKGFQGGVKRHGFHGGPRSHGQKHSEREVGSIGGRGRAGGRVSLGVRMPGRMGGDRITVKGLTVLGVDAANNELLISGAVPGRRGTVIEVMATPSEITKK